METQRRRAAVAVYLLFLGGTQRPFHRELARFLPGEKTVVKRKIVSRSLILGCGSYIPKRFGLKVLSSVLLAVDRILQ